MKVLFLGANGLDTGRLRIAAELRDVRAEIERAKERKQIDIRAELAIRPVDLSRVLLDEQPDVVHFSGHGVQLRVDASRSPRQTREFAADDDAPEVPPPAESSALLLENQGGGSIAVSPDALAELFGILKSQRCVVLNACFSASQAEAIAKHVDCVIGMKRAIDDASAAVFSAGFYQALARGTSVSEAFTLGKNLISICGYQDADVPELICREGVDPQNLRFVKAISENAPVRSMGTPKNVKRIFLASFVLLFVACTGYFVRPMALPPMKSAQGAIVVVTTRNPFDSSRDQAFALCAQLDEIAHGTEPRVVCQTRGYFDNDEALREKAANAGSSVFVVVDESQVAHLYPVGSLAQHDLLARHLPPIDLKGVNASQALAPLIREWARVADGAADGTLDRERLHCGESVAKEAFGLALSTMLLRRLANNCPSPNEDLVALRPQCRQESCTLLEGLEAKPLVRLTNCDAEADERLQLGCFRRHGFTSCREGKTAEAEQWLTLMDERQNAFYAVTASGLAACIASHASGLADERRAALRARAEKHEPECDIPTCSAVSGQCAYCASVFAERAGFWTKICDWDRARHDYDLAYRLSRDNEHLLGFIEVGLHRFSTTTAAQWGQSTAEGLKQLVNPTVEQKIRGALLAWVAAKRDGNKTYIESAEKDVLHAYDALLTRQSVYSPASPDIVERGLLCARTLKECPAYDLLTIPKESVTKEALRDALQHAVLPARGLCDEQP